MGPVPSDPDRTAAQQRFLSLFLRSEREIFRYVAVLVPNVAGFQRGWALAAVVVALAVGLGWGVFRGGYGRRGGTSRAAGRGTRVDGPGVPQWIPANPAGFAELFNLQPKSVEAEARRHDLWRESVRGLRHDPTLRVHFDFENPGAPGWRLSNAGALGAAVADGLIVGCEWREGRWATKPALEFRGLSDRVRPEVPGELESVTLAAWVRVQGLDRQINSLFMSDGFLPGTLHWVIRHDGVLGLTVIGAGGGHQIVTSPPVMAIDQLGIWTHLAVVLDGPAREAVHYVNGQPVSRHRVRVAPPCQLGAAELGNWNARGFGGDDPFLIRNFSGAIDEFCLFSRALARDEIASLHADGRPQVERPATLQRGGLGSAATLEATSNPKKP